MDELIADDASTHQGGDAVILHAGGYIDKGNQVPELLNRIERRVHVGSIPVIYLLGAHEWLMLRAVSGNRQAALEWLLSGAEASLDRWRVPVEDWIEHLKTTIPQSQIDFLHALPVSAFDGRRRFFCETFSGGPALPFGLFGRPGGMEALFDQAVATPVGNLSGVMRMDGP
jgi:serine/threonine protein phosphatase 1